MIACKAISTTFIERCGAASRRRLTVAGIICESRFGCQWGWRSIAQFLPLMPRSQDVPICAPPRQNPRRRPAFGLQLQAPRSLSRTRGLIYAVRRYSGMPASSTSDSPVSTTPLQCRYECSPPIRPVIVRMPLATILMSSPHLTISSFYFQVTQRTPEDAHHAVTEIWLQELGRACSRDDGDPILSAHLHGVL